MLVKRFGVKSELGLINEWLNKREMRPVDAEDIPEIGYIAFEEDFPVCAGFLRMVEGRSALLDSLITNPLATPELRNIAIDMVVECLIDTADTMQLKRVIAYTRDNHTLERSARFGFKRSKFVVIVRETQRSTH